MFSCVRIPSQPPTTGESVREDACAKGAIIPSMPRHIGFEVRQCRSVSSYAFGFHLKTVKISEINVARCYRLPVR